MHRLPITALWIAALAAAAPAAERLNVVLVLADDLGGRDLGCYGSKFHRTPNLDQMAKDGVRFTDAYAACPVCSPTRVAVLTGRYPQRANITDWLPGVPDSPDRKMLRPKINQQLSLDEVTLAEELKAAGYVTGHIGKWHLGGEGFEPTKQGFDVNVAGDHTGTPRSYFAPFKDAKGTFIPGLDQAPDGEYLTDRLAAEAEKFLDQNRDRPFFLYLPHHAVHTPLRAKEDLVKTYKPDGKPGTQNNPVYAAMLESLDQAVGRVLKKLDELKLSEKTLVIFTSDNGGLAHVGAMNNSPTINAPLREGKGFLYEGGVRVPLLVKWPGVVKAGTSDDTPVSSIDFFPTVLEACGVTGKGKTDGVSLVKRLRDGTPIAREALYWHYPHYHSQGTRPGGAVRAGDWKLTEFYDSDRRELFNLKADLSESRNLSADKPDVVADLKAKLDAWRKDVGAQMMTPNPNYKPNPQAADGSITLPARTADVHGTQLRYEPLMHKFTLGFWTKADDWASWEFEVTKPGRFTVEVLQGCGKGSGGAEVQMAVGDQSLTFTVEDTGGFQNFKARDVGTITIAKAGRQTLEVRARSKPGVAVMDLRQVKLTPVKP